MKYKITVAVQIIILLMLSACNTDPSVSEEVDDTDHSVPEEVDDTEPSVPEEIDDTEPSVPDEIDDTEPSVPEEIDDTDPSVPDEIDDTDPSVPEEVDDTEPSVPTENWFKPTLLMTWQWQLSGDINTGYDVEMYDIDLFDTSQDLIQQIQSSGKKVICYFSAGSYEDWRDDASDFNESDLGNPLGGWDGENWLDVRSSNVRAIMQQRLDLARQKGCDGVEPDNMDGYTNNPGFNLTGADQVDYSRFIAQQAHDRNLAVGLKNDLDQIDELVDYFDFAVNEQCFEYSECDRLLPFIENNKPVFNAEYKPNYRNNQADRDSLCAASMNMGFSTLILPLELDDSFRYSCL